jgi:hypothetical protein
MNESGNGGNERLTQEQFYQSGSGATQSNVDGWSQPIGWSFGVVFIILGALVAWSKYIQKR